MYIYTFYYNSEMNYFITNPLKNRRGDNLNIGYNTSINAFHYDMDQKNNKKSVCVCLCGVSRFTQLKERDT